MEVNEADFQHMLLERGRELYRDMPWRDDTRPYYVLVSELMLQQTQVQRVIPKFEQFIQLFPNERELAKASLADVLHSWQGLGYNRRAKFLHDATKMIQEDFKGVFPRQESDLLRLPGVGKNTAGAVQAYAFNVPSIFIETNIRTVYIHHFFSDDFQVEDRQIVSKLKATLDQDNPRQFFQALMDYGTWLKANGVRNNSKSKHYKKQPPLKGSLREMRGEIIRNLTQGGESLFALDRDPRFDEAMSSLIRDGLVGQAKTGHFYLTK